MCVQSKLRDGDRVLLKDRLCDPSATRAKTVENVSWQSALAKSGLEAMEFVHELVYLKTCDNVLRQAIKPNSHPELLQECESIQEIWKRVTHVAGE